MVYHRELAEFPGEYLVDLAVDEDGLKFLMESSDYQLYFEPTTAAHRRAHAMAKQVYIEWRTGRGELVLPEVLAWFDEHMR